ncbi:Acyl-CoA N-acyltransferase [Penicillium paradoxum]|uniref:Acyl-CoA N-acyltransferase n=1 Tax=Penicillium paradoxum TaxID=176176 RepID=UPI002546F538|nr:Acyl-CoA N-acyltransferase [Penicillium paradoxum]KAJ5780096.1 Acyl-CoA N-acyltransferase [Penicillium paradoxum]
MDLIQYATEADGPGLAKINVQSFLGRRLLEEVFPGTSQARMQEYKGIVAMKHLATPNTHVLKIHDPASGELVAYSRWHLPDSFGQSLVPLSDQAALFAKDPLPYAPQPMNEEIFRAFKKLLEDSRKRYTTENDMILDLLATLPGYQGRGFGSAVLKWGTEKADASQSRIFLEATPEGIPLYLKHGWKILEEVTIDYAAFGSTGSESFSLMMRDPLPQ